MSGWTRPQLFWIVLSRDQRLCGDHVANARIQGAWRTIQPLPYTCGNFMVRQVLES
jgi:hypothetical protein